MKLYKLFLLIVAIYVFVKISEKFVNFTDLDGYDNKFIKQDNPKIKNFKPKKTSDLIGYCDEKRSQCISY